MTNIGKGIVRFFVRIHMIAKTPRYLRLAAKELHLVVCEITDCGSHLTPVEVEKLLGVSLRLQALADILDAGESKIRLPPLPPQKRENTPPAPAPADLPHTPDLSDLSVDAAHAAGPQ